MIGTWRGFARGARVTIPVVVVTALVQAVLVIGDPTPEGTWGFTLRAVASVVAVIVALWLVVWAAASAVRPGATFSMPPASRPPVGLLAGAAGAVGLGAVAGILSPVLPLVVAVAGLPALTALATTPRWSTSRSVRRSPGRVVLALGLTVLVFVVDWVLALVLGFFVGGPVSAALTWVVFGVTAAFLATHWAVLHRRAAG